MDRIKSEYSQLPYGQTFIREIGGRLCRCAVIHCKLCVSGYDLAHELGMNNAAEFLSYVDKVKKGNTMNGKIDSAFIVNFIKEPEFKLAKNGEMPLLSFSAIVGYGDTAQFIRVTVLRIWPLAYMDASQRAIMSMWRAICAWSAGRKTGRRSQG